MVRQLYSIDTMVIFWTVHQCVLFMLAEFVSGRPKDRRFMRSIRSLLVETYNLRMRDEIFLVYYLRGLFYLFNSFNLFMKTYETETSKSGTR